MITFNSNSDSFSSFDFDSSFKNRFLKISKDGCPELNIILVLVLGYQFFQNNWKEFYLIAQISPTNVLVISLLVIFEIIIGALPKKLLLKHFNIDLKVNELLPLFIYSSHFLFTHL